MTTLVSRTTLPLRSTLITRVSSLLQAAPPLVLVSVFFLMVFAICHFPFTSRTRFSRSVPKPVLSSCRLYTDCHRARKAGVVPTDPGANGLPQFWQYLQAITMRHRTVCFRSSSQYVPATPDGMTFARSLTTAPFERSSTGWFEACSCKPASGALLPSSVRHHRSAACV